VLATVELNDELSLPATKVGDEVTDRKLAPKLKASELFCPQALPIISSPHRFPHA
jgi:hypothetical protein